MARMDAPFHTLRYMLAGGIDVRGIAACREVTERCTGATKTYAVLGTFAVKSGRENDRLYRPRIDIIYALATVVHATTKKVGDSVVPFPPSYDNERCFFEVIRTTTMADVSLAGFQALVARSASILRAPFLEQKSGGYEDGACEDCAGNGEIVVYDDFDIEHPNRSYHREYEHCTRCNGSGYSPGPRAAGYNGALTRSCHVPHWILDPAEYDLKNEEDVGDAWIQMESHRESVAIEPYIVPTGMDPSRIRIHGARLGERALAYVDDEKNNKSREWYVLNEVGAWERRDKKTFSLSLQTETKEGEKS